MLRTYQSNDLTSLAACLAEVLKTDSFRSPLQPEIIVVPNQGMARWLSLQIADRLGICANIHFQFPAEYIWSALRQFFTDIPPQSILNVDYFRWRIMSILPTLIHRPEFTPVARYLDDGDLLKQYELSQQIAQIFDRYMVYRPEWVCAWEQGAENHWQAQLWRQLVQPDKMMHWAQLLQRLQQLSQDTQHPLFPRALLFAVPTLSPGYIQALGVIGKYSDCHLFMRNPCRVYWHDIKSKSEIIRHELRSAEQEDFEHYFTTGNSLLASWGREGREYLGNLLALHSEDIECFVDLQVDTLLTQIQSDILNLEEPECSAEKRLLAADDHSIKVEVVHSAQREVEVLHDQLLAMFAANPDLQVENVVVMMPDIETYVPHINSIFSGLVDKKHIPYSIADHNALAESPLVRTFFALLNLSDSRFESAFIFELLQCDALREHFDFSDDDLPVVQHLIKESGIRWAMNAAHRGTFNLPETNEHSWQFGLDRLLLGYCMQPEGDNNIFSGIHPVADIEGDNAQLVSRLIYFIRCLNRWRQRLYKPRSMPAWMVLCQQLLDSFFAENSSDLSLIYQALESVKKSVEDSKFNDSVDLAVVQESLSMVLEALSSKDQFLGRGVTFCALLPMRSIPFEVVCLIGMHGTAFPRFDRRVGFDLLRQYPRRGDRSARNEDRYLFLEAFISARQYFYISYVGQHIRDNSVIPPCVLVSELLDYIDAAYVLENNKIPSSRLVTRHPLQGFSVRYFNEKETALFTYSREYQLASSLAEKQPNDPPFFSGSLTMPDASWRQVSLADLIQFYSMPSRYLLQQRLKINLNLHSQPLVTSEPFNMDRAAERQLDHALFKLPLEKINVQQLKKQMQAAGLLPHGQPGEIQFSRHYMTNKQYQHDFSLLTADDKFEIVEFKISLGPFILYGELAGITHKGLFTMQPNALLPKDSLSAWLSHLVLNQLKLENIKAESYLMSKKESMRFIALDGAENILENLLALYWQGLQRPLKFFPTTSHTYYSQLNSKRAKISPLNAAENKWHGGDYWGEGQDSYNELAFRNAIVFDDEFSEIAMQIFTPMYESMEKL
ncbi:MAG: exodeoxyribonuclease V subunit gamma [Gammaproteobacteria bacterium]|nr:exodeoxyribonuclease V subunit gamma [Gammaproteobacteria bacterium]